MATAPGFDPVVWMLLLALVSGILSDDNNTSHNEVLCPPDSVPDAGAQCVCDSSRCPQPPPCDPPLLLETTPADGLPGNCCDKYTCVSPPASNSSDAETVCPEDSYRLRSVGCQCLPAACLVKVCPPGTWAKIVRPGSGQPGACCPLYECATADSNSTCIDNGTLMQNGSSWLRADCTQCRCDGGLTFCVPVGRVPHDSSICRPLPADCTRSTVPQGQCCPVCVGSPEDLDSPPPGSCVALGQLQGKTIPAGGTWQEDDCTTCVCRDGQRQCQAYMCEACANPRYEPGECCPRCNGSVVVTVPSHCPPLDNCSLRCVHGFVRDINGCFTCHCQQDECLLECEHGFAQDSHGNMLCKCSQPKCAPLSCRKVCPHGYRTNKAGCEVCRCESCKPLDQCTKRCAHGLSVNANNCVICKCIPHGLIGGVVNVTDTTVGTPCISDSKVWRDDGETWFDGCRQCYCLSGREMCSLLSCPPISCANPVYNSSKDCCPSCSGTDLVPASHMVCQGETPGRLYKEGETWRLSPCVECVCQSGRALCHAAYCPPTPCRRPLPPPPGECCPVCPPEQLANFSLSTHCERRQGERTWKEGNCVSCLCDNERPSCFTELCEHQGPCKNALQVKNQCCPICLDVPEALDSKLCTVDNATYSVGQDWREDECTTCMCISGGEISCTKLVCSVNCPNPVKKAGVCCHVCPDTESFWTGREVVYIMTLALLAGALVCLALYVARQCRLKRHQLKLPSTYGCPPPQYTQYKYMPTYDSPQPSLPTSDKTALTPL